MGKLDRYIARHVLAAMLLVLLVLGGLDMVFTLIDELGDSEGGYGTLAAFKYVLYTAPRHVYELLSPAALIGSLAGLGSLAAANELVGMQAAGYSRWQLTRAVMQPAILVMLLGFVLGEYLAPQLELQAEVDKSLARGQSIGLSRYGHWERDGQSFLHFNTIETSGVLHGVTLFEFDDQQRLSQQLLAEQAVYVGATGGSKPEWQLINGSRIEFNYNGSDVSSDRQQFSQLSLPLDLTPDLLQVVIVDPDRLSISDLWRFGNRFLQQGLDASPYFLGFWKKALQPVNTAVLVLVAISFIFGPLRSASMGSRLFSAISLGLIVTIVQRLLQNLSLVYHLQPLAAVLLPIVLCLLAGIVLLRRRA